MSNLSRSEKAKPQYREKIVNDTQIKCCHSQVSRTALLILFLDVLRCKFNNNLLTETSCDTWKWLKRLPILIKSKPFLGVASQLACGGNGSTCNGQNERSRSFAPAVSNRRRGSSSFLPSINGKAAAVAVLFLSIPSQLPLIVTYTRYSDTTLTQCPS